MIKKVSSILFVLVFCLSILAGCNTNKNENTENTSTVENGTEAKTVEINAAALKGPTAMGMVKLMKDSDENNTGTNKYNFTICAAPDEITPKITRGDFDIAAVPSNLASVLYNKTEGDIQVLAINTLGVLYIAESGDSVHSVSDLKGKTIYTIKGATPESALNYILTKNGIDPENDVTIEFKTEHSECVAALVSKENAIALIPQPFITTALAKNDKIRIALDMNEEWEKLQETQEEKSALITGVIVARTDFIKENKDAVDKFLEQYKASVEYVNGNLDQASELIGGYDIVPEAIAKKALPYCNITFIDGDEMKQSLEGYLKVLYGMNPETVGGKVPDEAFYYKK